VAPSTRAIRSPIQRITGTAIEWTVKQLLELYDAKAKRDAVPNEEGKV